MAGEASLADRYAVHDSFREAMLAHADDRKAAGLPPQGWNPWLKEAAQAFQTTVKINADAGWITCSRCLEGYQSCKRDARCDCELLCEDQEKGCLEDGEAEGCVLVEVRAPFHVTPVFLRDMYRAHWLPLVYN